MRLLHRFAWPLALLWALVILLLSITPGPNLPPVNLWEFDKFAHVGVYALLTFLLSAAHRAQFSSPKSRSIAGSGIWFVIALYGLLIELVQGNFIPGRYFDVLDILANIIGSSLGILAYIILMHRYSST